MSTVFAEKVKTMLPSEALNREFVLDAAAMAELNAPEEKKQSVNTHAVLVGNIGLLLPQDEVSELIENMAVCRLPNTSTWFDGVTSVRGNMIPVFDLHELFAIEHAGAKRRLIVVGENETAVAFWVDDFPRLVSLDQDDGMTSTPPIPPLIRDHAHNYYLREGQIWVDWNIESFFTILGEML